MATIFKEVRLIEKYGSGIKRIRAEIAADGLKAPVFENFQHGIRALVFTAPYDAGVRALRRLISFRPGKKSAFPFRKA